MNNNPGRLLGGVSGGGGSAEYHKTTEKREPLGAERLERKQKLWREEKVQFFLNSITTTSVS